ncbi:MAG TPA: chemotaxis protein CheW [Treponemataceae bacterium]|nr:chemotaxis protein CheW [Treponemataceae bacterium]HPS43022.1 chemotaxis protein CheW [Treponemataceae bacterium]
METTQNSNDNQYLTFEMAGENYAIPIAHIREVLLVPTVTRIPRMPDFMRGVINLRGAVVPVLDLRLKFGMGNTELTAATSIIVIEIPTPGDDSGEKMMRLGVFADSVRKVVTIMPENVEPPPRIGMRVKTAFILGMGRVDDGFIVILNIRDILRDEDLVSVEESAMNADAERIVN